MSDLIEQLDQFAGLVEQSLAEKPEPLAAVLPHLVELGVSHLAEYFGVWAIHEEPFRAAVDRVRGIDLRGHVELQQSQAKARAQAETAYPVTKGGVALISLSGPLMKYASSLSGGSSTVLARRQIRLAAADEEVQAIALIIDSPGGTVSGTKDLADDVAAAAAKKPVAAYIEDLGASAAYWVASQATSVHANETALVGSIGTFATLFDMSGMAAQEGVKVHVIRAGAFKGSGTPGTEITHEQLAETQRVVDEINEHFLKGVSKGRKLSLSAVRELADGRVHLAAAAKGLGLIDSVQTLDRTIQQLSTVKGRNRAMSQEVIQQASEKVNTAPAIAAYAEIVAGCPGADPAFICAQLAAKASLDTARAAWMTEQNNRLTAARKETEDAKTAAAAASARTGVPPLNQLPATQELATAGEAAGTFQEAVAAKVKAGMPRSRAVSAVVREKPELHRAYLQEHNLTHGRKRAVEMYLAD